MAASGPPRFPASRPRRGSPRRHEWKKGLQSRTVFCGRRRRRQDRCPNWRAHGRGPPVLHRRARGDRTLDPVGQHADLPGGRRAPLDRRAAVPYRPQCTRRGRRGAWRQIRSHRFQPVMRLDPDIFKAYDVRGTYPDQVHEEGARAIGAAFVAYLKAKRIGVGRDMRLSSPALAAAFIDGALSQGADVVDYGMIATDMLYFAVATDGLDGGVMITASHNPKQYNGMKMVRQEAIPLSGDAGISDIRDMIAADRLPAAAARRGRVTTRDVLEPYVDHVMRFIDPTIVAPFKAVLDAGSGMGGLVAPKLFDRLPCRT